MVQELLVIILAVPHFLILDCITASYQTFDVLRNSDIFVDKTFLITKFLTMPSRQLLVTAPPGFGKTTNLDMIRQYAEMDIFPNGTMKTDQRSHKNYRTFVDVVPSTGKHLSVFLHKEQESFKKHFGQYPVIWLDFDTKGVETNDKLSFMRFLLNGTIRAAFEHHAYLLDSPEISSDDKELFQDFVRATFSAHARAIGGCTPRFGIGLLKKLLKKHFQRDSIVLVDNCDAPIRGMILNQKQQNNEAIGVSNELTNILEAIPDNDFGPDAEPSYKSFVTGVLKPFYRGLQVIGDCRWKWDVHSYRHIHGFGVSHLLNSYGFVQKEMKALLQARNLKSKIDQLEKWYGGYVESGYRNKKRLLFNPQSVNSFLASKTKELKAYWTELGSLSTFESVFLPECFGHQVVECFCGDGFITETVTLNGESWVQAQMLRDLQKLPIHLSQCTNQARYSFMMYMARLGYLTYNHNYGNTFKIPNLEVGHYVKKLLYNAIVTKTPINGDSQFRVELFGAISDVDGSETSMRRFADALVTLLVATEQRPHATSVDNATIAHFVRVHLLCPPTHFKVKYLKASFSKEKAETSFSREKNKKKSDSRGELVFAVEGKKGLLEFDVKMELGNQFETTNRTVKDSFSNTSTSGVPQNSDVRLMAKVFANLSCGKDICYFSYLYNSTDSHQEHSVEIKKENILNTAKAKWKSV